MELMLSHLTALEVIRRQELRLSLEWRQRCDAPVPGRGPSDAELAGLIAQTPLLGRLAQPIETLVADEAGRRRSKRVKTHTVSRPLPAGSAFLVAPGVRCVSPEHLAVQMAPRLTELELIVLLSELMGTYAIAPELESGMWQRWSAPTTRDMVLAHLDALGSFPGAAKVRRALGRACVNSGSPRETKLSLRLGLNPARGGYGLDVLSMNAPLEVTRIRDRMRAGIRKPDILLRAPADAMRNGRALLGAAVEYDGRDHASEEAHARDAERHNELTAIGIVEYLVTRRQYRDLAYMDGLVDLIRRDLGTPAKRRTHRESERLRRLRLRLYLELERIDGVRWGDHGRGRDQADVEVRDVVPVEAYGIG